MEDRFTKLAKNYDIFSREIFAAQGLDYDAMQQSVLDAVVKHGGPSWEPILDIGTGHGQTLEPFVRLGFSDLTGMDFNRNMLDAAYARLIPLGKVKLVQADATNMGQFYPRQFGTIISATCIHNIPRSERPKVWSELERLQPNLFVDADKIAYDNPTEHQARYEREIKALVEVFDKRHGLKDICDEWIRHYEVDEREKMTLDEIRAGLPNYDIFPTFEMGVNKTIVGIRRK